MFLSSFKAPSAWVPVAMSVVALVVVAGHLVASGSAPEVDEGAAAHVWQLLIVGQLPVIAWFALRRMSAGRSVVAPVMAVQMAAMLLAAAPVALLGL
jgi:hypothetical protein